METTQTATKTALWVPGWYELDQSIVLGARDRFWFYVTPPLELLGATSFDFVFFNQLSASGNFQVREATIAEIEHPQLGLLRQIDTDGLDYIFYPVSGDDLVVNAEENPGAVYDNPLTIVDWAITVTLADVSEPVVDFV